MTESVCRACSREIPPAAPEGLCWECLLAIHGLPSEMLLEDLTDNYFREYGSGLACPCCGSQLTVSEISSRACALCGDMVGLDFLLRQVNGLVASWQESA